MGPPIKLKNLERRSREYLTTAEVKGLIDAAKDVGRHGARDALLILVMYRHALRVSELADLKWDQVDLNRGRLHVNRLKNGEPSVHYLEGDEIRALRKLRRDYASSEFVFVSERQGPLSANAIHKLVARAGREAALELSVHPHMLRHGKGFQLASEGIDTRAIQAYMGHKNIQHTVLYTQLNPKRFRGFGKDVQF
ncbi:MAG: tyrosine-type recombinase/integrase [Candidatus Obscuribacter sp.]|nr:tyrosine-type recombinase/integrase [Candidatus Obscuribacter sp.]